MKLRLCALAAVLAVAYGAWVGWGGDRGRAQLSPGPVARVHQAWRDDCQVCHADYVPLSPEAASWTARWFSGYSAAEHPVRTATAERCQHCHGVWGHHRLQRDADIAACTACHHDHQGDSHDLRRVADAQCTRCHARLDHHRTGPSIVGDPLVDVTRFTLPAGGSTPGHPEFRSLRNDPGQIKFNHRLHMTPGLPATDAAGRPGRTLLTLADLPVDEVERFGHLSPSSRELPEDQRLVQLNCAVCHHLQATATDDSAGQVIGAGAYYAPITYARDCQGCHPLRAGTAPAEPQVPHGLTAVAVQQFLRQWYSAAALGALPGSPAASGDAFVPQRLVPGRAQPDTPDSQRMQSVDQQVQLALAYLNSQAVCTKCHLERGSTSAETPSATALSALFPELARSNIPVTWFRHAQFNHQPHRHILCGECHPAAFPDGGPPAFPAAAPAARPDHQTVMIAGRELCIQCHGATNPGTAGAIARNDCTLCHRYHGSDAGVPPTVPPARPISDWLEPPSHRP